MSVKRIEAWETSNGNAYVKKSEAVHEEMVWLLQNKVELQQRGFDIDTFKSKIVAYKELLAELQALRKGIDGRSSKRTVEDLDQLVTDTEAWLTTAESLKDNMAIVE